MVHSAILGLRGFHPRHHPTCGEKHKAPGMVEETSPAHGTVKASTASQPGLRNLLKKPVQLSSLHTRKLVD